MENKMQLLFKKKILLERCIQQIQNETLCFEYIPEYNPVGYPNQKALYIQGISFQGKSTKAFAYIGFPENIHSGHPIPAVVLVHGGGGYAFPEWVKKWNDRGYAAIAFCHTGHRPVNSDITKFESADSWTRDEILGAEWIPGPDNDSMANTDAELNNQWIFHGIALTIFAHNILRNDDRVDSDRIGLTGISWGSVIASIVIGYDMRFAFAIPVYGSGFLDEGLGWVQQLFKPVSTKMLWEAGERLAAVRIPVLWLCWANDPAFSIQPNSKSCNITPNGEISIQLDISHGHWDGWNPPEIYRFADAIVNQGQSLVKCITQPSPFWYGNGCKIQIQCPCDVDKISARLVYITEPMTYSPNGVIKWDGCNTIDQIWNVTDCFVDNNCVSYDIPEDAVSYYVEFTTSCGNQTYISTSNFITVTRSENK